MSLNFSLTRRKASFLDPFNEFKPASLVVEVRTDPLSGHMARVLKFRARTLDPVDHSLYLKRAAKLTCPFCPENIVPLTSRFLPQEVAEGRLSLGEAVCFPNAFPYEAMNAVVVLCKAHYLKPSQFTPRLLADGLLLAREAFSRVARGLSYGSVNWNYMMPAGAGLVHPHLQIAAGRTPTSFQERLRKRALAHARHGGADIAADYLAAEKKAGARWLGRLGPAGWVTAFAPRAVFDIMALVPGGRGLMRLSAGQVLKLAEGITRVLAFFEEKGVGAFNMALHTPLGAKADLPLMLRLVSRVDIPPMGIDEINYFEKLHDEKLSFLPPESVAEDLRPRFKGAKP